MDSETLNNSQVENSAPWQAIVAEYQKPSFPRALWQMVNTFVPYVILWYLMYRSLAVSYWLTLPLMILVAGFQIRVFIIHHDCGHGSYFKSRKANDLMGFITGVLTFTPYYLWRWEHAIHHAGSGDLNRRGTGDVWTLTVREYLESSRWRRFSYRLVRNPLVLFVIAPFFLFAIWHRFPPLKASKRERYSVYWTNLAILGVAAALIPYFGIKAYLTIQLLIIAISGSVGVWMFYVQHQFEGVYWERGENWDYATAALQGSSFYKLPKVLQWFSGNIGYHHIHHLSARIPNYNLERCHKAHLMFQGIKPITLLTSLQSLKLRLWDEENKKLVSYRHLRELRKRS